MNLSTHPFRMLIDGKLVSQDATMDVINPATEEVLTRVPVASKATADAAVEAARRAFPAWKARSVEERRAVLCAIADAVDAHADELRELITLEQGKPLSGSAMEVSVAPQIMRYFASFDFKPRILQDDGSQYVELHRRPLGVVLAIVPWNFPFLMALYKMGPALAAGNTFVLKPSPTTPLSALRLGEIIQSVVPPGVVNVLCDDGTLGPHLTAHPDVAKVSFTGSTATGRAVMASAAPTLKRLTLELGGNDAAIVLDDANVKAIAPQLFGLAFVNSGQVCMSIKRLYVQSGIYEEMCTEFARLARQAKVGDGRNPETEFGPVQNRRQFEAICSVLEQAPKYGKVIAGGDVKRPGFFVQPTVIRDIAEGNPVVDEEIFGPVRSLLRFHNVDEAVRRANASPYGLGASVWSSDVERAVAIGSRLEAGSVWINQHFAVAPHIPFGGTKQSGIGVEFSEEGLNEYTSIQSLVVNKT